MIDSSEYPRPWGRGDNRCFVGFRLNRSVALICCVDPLNRSITSIDFDESLAAAIDEVVCGDRPSFLYGSRHLCPSLMSDERFHGVFPDRGDGAQVAGSLG